MSVIYKTSMTAIGRYVPEKLQPLWKHPAGPQTIFFWAPAFKWGLVIAGLSDLRRPASELSVSQSTALGLTGLVWTRYSLVIIPKNYGLFSVNLFVACTALYQVSRAIMYQRKQAAAAAAGTATTPAVVVLATNDSPGSNKQQQQ